MKNISPSQLRAARALLNWSRADLASKANVSEPTLHRYENAPSIPGGKTVIQIITALNQHGIEFLDNQGVRIKPNNIDVYDGVERFHAFYEFLYEHINTYGGELCLSIYNEATLKTYRDDHETHRQRLKTIMNKKNAKLRILTTISDFITYDFCEFRWLPNQVPTPTGFYAFGDCLALISLANEKSPHIVVIHSAPIAEGYRQGFNNAWGQAKHPPTKSIQKI